MKLEDIPTWRGNARDPSIKTRSYRTVRGHIVEPIPPGLDKPEPPLKVAIRVANHPLPNYDLAVLENPLRLITLTNP
jgi:hypothetical protein